MKSAHCKVAMKQKEDKLSPGYKTFIITSGEMKNKQTNKQATKKSVFFCPFLSCLFLSCVIPNSVYSGCYPLCHFPALRRSYLAARCCHMQQTHSAESAAPQNKLRMTSFPGLSQQFHSQKKKKKTKLNTKGGFRFQILVNAHSSEQE